MVVKLEQWQRANCSHCINKFGHTMLGPIGNFDVVLDCTSFWPTEVEMDRFSIEEDHYFSIPTAEKTLEAGHGEVLEDDLETLVAVSLSCTSVCPRLIIWSISSMEGCAEWGIMLMGKNSQDYGYEYYSNQQCKLHGGKSDSHMWPSYFDNMSKPAVRISFHLSAKNLHALLLYGSGGGWMTLDSKDLLMLWDPGGIHISSLRASPVQFI